MRIFIIFLISIIFNGHVVWATPPIKISIGTGDSTSEKVYTEIIAEAYRRIGHETKFLKAPKFKSSALVNKGIADAAAVRVEDAYRSNEKIVKVPVVIGTVNIAAISLGAGRLENLMTYRGGTVQYLEVIKDILPEYDILLMNDLKSLSRKLVSRQLDYILYFPQVFQYYSAQNYPTETFTYTIIKQRNLFHYISKDRLDLKELLIAAFQSMHEDGYILKKLKSYGFKVNESFLRRVQ